MLKVRLACPICGTPILARSLDAHMNRHEVCGAGVLTLRLHPTSPYQLEPGEPPEEPPEPPGPPEPPPEPPEQPAQPPQEPSEPAAQQ